MGRNDISLHICVVSGDSTNHSETGRQILAERRQLVMFSDDCINNDMVSCISNVNSTCIGYRTIRPGYGWCEVGLVWITDEKYLLRYNSAFDITF